MSQNFKAGDLVELKSGGPVMTVEKVHKDLYGDEGISYSCSWFSGAKDNHRSFQQESLKKSLVAE